MDDVRWMRQCPRWDRCSANCCPLDPMARDRKAQPDDPERRCKSRWEARLKIGEAAAKAGAKLPWGGLTEAESGHGVEALRASAERKRQAFSRQKGAKAPLPKDGTPVG